MGQYNVAVIGGGAAGLSAAMFMQGSTLKNKDVVQCDVYESQDRVGGNVDTAFADEQYAMPFGDLGVNDFNHETYSLFTFLLELLKNQGFDVPFKPLIDTTLFFTPDGQEPVVRYTYEEMQSSNDPRLTNIRNDWNRFSANITDALGSRENLSKTVGEYCKEQGYSDDFINYNLMPRINGMYYTNGENPESMSIYGVLKYYALQENISNPDAKNTRMYFVEGASSWVRALEGYLRKLGGVVNTGVKAELKRIPESRHWSINGKTYEKVVFALPANQLASSFNGAIPNAVLQIASGFNYLRSTTYYHKDPRVLPSDTSLWQTYNITIQPTGQTGDRPYVITYVTAMHQGQNNQQPPLISLNPQRQPNDILMMVDPEDTGQKIPALVDLEHNTLYPENIKDQNALGAFQGDYGLYYTGGWTVGAGLHEEILGQSLLVAMMILGQPTEHLHEVHKPDDPDYMPRHLRALIHNEKPDGNILPENHPLLRTDAT